MADDEASAVSGSPATGTTVVAQFRVRPDAEAAFARWQDEVAVALSAWPGFVQQTVMPPTPPVDVRWTIFQWFDRESAAVGWLGSPERQRLLAAAQPILAGPDDIHLVRASTPAPTEPASLVVATRVRPEAEARYRDWQHRIANVLSGAPGFLGYRFERPVAGVRDEWLVVIRFETEAALSGWLASPGRRDLLDETDEFTLARTVRTVESAFEQWLPASERPGTPSPWKMSMLVLAVLYPSVFLLDTFLVPPLARAGFEPWLTIFIGNVVCVLVLGLLVPRVAKLFGWWLAPEPGTGHRTDGLGAGTVIGLYLATLLACSIVWQFAQ